MATSPTSPEPELPELDVRPRLRVYLGEEIALGPGKAELLAGIAAAGTLNGAAAAVGMSYMRAWRLLQTMNACFREPLVATSRGGAERGRARLTPTGEAVLDLYRRMEEQCVRSLAPLREELRQRLREAPK